MGKFCSVTRLVPLHMVDLFFFQGTSSVFPQARETFVKVAKILSNQYLFKFYEPH